jgi:flagellar biogenesis protein FliO
VIERPAQFPRNRALAGVLVIVLLCGSVQAQQAPLSTPAPSPESSTMIRRGASPAPSSTQQVGGQSSSQLVDVPRVLGALGIVIALIFALRLLGKKFIPGVQAGKGNSAIKLIGRSIVTPKHQVLLLQVGRRVMVAADNGAQLTSLGEITDPDEVALLIGQVDAAQPESATSTFSSLVGSAQTHFQDEPQPQTLEPPAAQLQPDLPEDGSAPDPARTELSSLMSKVRLLSQQFRRTT